MRFNEVYIRNVGGYDTKSHFFSSMIIKKTNYDNVHLNRKIVIDLSIRE